MSFASANAPISRWSLKTASMRWRLTSPWWRIGPVCGRQYLRKRLTLLQGQANLVEIDLLRGGGRMPMVDQCPENPYYLMVARKTKPFRCDVWASHFREALPEIPVPLRSPDRDVPLALQPLVDAVQARSRYDQDIDYRQPLRPAVVGDDVAWLKKHLRSLKS